MNRGDASTIADVAFDTPVAHAFSYAVPAGWIVSPGQRVFAPLGMTETGFWVDEADRDRLAALYSAGPGPGAAAVRLESMGYVASRRPTFLSGGAGLKRRCGGRGLRMRLGGVHKGDCRRRAGKLATIGWLLPHHCLANNQTDTIRAARRPVAQLVRALP